MLVITDGARCLLTLSISCHLPSLLFSRLRSYSPRVRPEKTFGLVFSGLGPGLHSNEFLPASPSAFLPHVRPDGTSPVPTSCRSASRTSLLEEKVPADRLRLAVAFPPSSGNCLRHVRTEAPACTASMLRHDAVGRVLVITDGVRCLLTLSISCHLLPFSSQD